jgi:hypothetical protein
MMVRKDEINKTHATGMAIYAAVKALVEVVHAPLLKAALDGRDQYLDDIREQMRLVLLENLDKRITELEIKADHMEKIRKYFNGKGKDFLYKTMTSALNAEYIEKQQIFIKALFNGVTTDIEEDEKLHFIDLIRSLSKVDLNILSVVHKVYDKDIDNSLKTGEIEIDRITTLAGREFQYPPELIEASLRELRNKGLFSNIITWRKGPNNTFSPLRYTSENTFHYTHYTRRFVKFIID